MLYSEYRREMEQLGPRQEELSRLYAAMEKRKRGRRLGRRGAAAVLICAVLAVSALAVGPTVWENIQARLGPFATLAQPIEGAACTDQGIEVQVVSTLLDDVRGEVYFTVRDVTEDRLDSQLKLEGKLSAGEEKEVQQETGSIGAVGYFSTSNFQIVSYDPETRTALYAAKVLYGESGQPVRDAKLSITGMTTRQGEMYGSASCADVTAAALESLPLTEENRVVQSTAEARQGRPGAPMPSQRVALAPNLTPMDIEGNQDIWVSSMGIASDGCFHVRLAFADGVDLAYYYNETNEASAILICSLGLAEGAESNEKQFIFQASAVPGGVDCLFPLITAEDVGQISEVQFSLRYTRPGELIEGSWPVDFQMEYYPSAILGWSGELAGRYISQVTLSPMTVTMYSNDEGGFHGAMLYAEMEDGSVITAKAGTGRYSNVGNGYSTYNIWEFEEPVDVENVVSLTLLEETIPVN